MKNFQKLEKKKEETNIMMISSMTESIRAQEEIEVLPHRVRLNY